MFDEKGVARALSADPITRRNTVGKDYSWRNYFKGAWHLAGKGLASTYVSPAFKGEADGTYKFNISAPLFGSKRQPIGILAAAVPTAANLGSLVVRDSQSVAVLAAPRDRERDPPEPASTHLILLHPDYTYGEEAEMTAGCSTSRGPRREGIRVSGRLEDEPISGSRSWICDELARCFPSAEQASAD